MSGGRHGDQGTHPGRRVLGTDGPDESSTATSGTLPTVAAWKGARVGGRIRSSPRRVGVSREVGKLLRGTSGVSGRE